LPVFDVLPPHWRWSLKRSGGRIDRDLIHHHLANADAPKLHIGCGEHKLSGWLNSDYFPKSTDILHLDARRPFPFADCTFDYIFSEHMIEHIPYANGVGMIAECFRTLKPNGRMRLATPDLAFVVDLYRPDLSDLQRQYIKWSAHTFMHDVPDDNAVFVVNNFVRDWGHTFIYDERTLRDAMAQAGFVDIVRRDLQESGDPVLSNLENEERMPPGFLRLESLTLEATKPA
jgi:predicted SAM-dependent methyltransferase